MTDRARPGELHPLVAKLTALRAARKLNRTETARLIGVSREGLWRYEEGRVVPGIEVLSAWARAFGLTLRIE